MTTTTKTKMGKKITFEEGRDFTMTALMHHLNREYGAKRSGELFNVRDIQQYMLKEQIPAIYGGQKLKQVTNSVIGIKVLRLYENR